MNVVMEALVLNAFWTPGAVFGISEMRVKVITDIITTAYS